MGLVRRYSEINRSAKEESANGDDRREKSWFTKKGSGVLLGDEDGNEEEERTRRTGPAIYVSISWRARVRRDSRLSSWLDHGRGPRETRPPASRVESPSSLGTSVLYTDIAHGVGPQKMHPETQPLYSRAHSYSILALCFSTSVILVDDYIVGMLARPQPRTDFYEDNSGPDFFEAREMFEYQSNSRHSQDSVEMQRRQCGRRSVGEKKGIVNALEPQFEPVSHNKL
ncbi:hypothetical protein G5I_08093 [Acromyrmex echinatior]|uniref:Uncharacterized protein n=1 Tax=Acromyrmex echinatior TaxID=103372 RepID=F4WQH4_ACREC|nr:hypothetical protein G5I_08093 [Acromyrmex echinatior]